MTHITDKAVLVVDDEEFQREILVEALSAIGIRQIFEAGGGDAALAMLQSTAIDILITDIRMPGMDGPQFLRHLADIDCKAAIILHSGVSSDIQRSIGKLGRSHGLNIVGFIHKPVTLEMLEHILTAAMATQRITKARTSVASHQEFSAEQLRQALEQRQIHPWYQPKVDIQKLRLVGVEALARWRTADGSLVSPGQFVPAIEQAGMADELFFCMLDQALTDMDHWREAGRDFKVSINLSMECAIELDLPDRIETYLKRHAVPVERLVIEVTESQLMADAASALETLTRLSLLGLTLSIDDFGTGYSSLSQIAALPFAELKLDGSFVQQAGKNTKANAILMSMITLGRSLGMEVVAEGVETHEQLDTLLTWGADVLQGYLVAKPMPADRFGDWLDGWRPGTASRPECNRPYTILVVDDEMSMRQVGEAIFKKRLPSARVLTAADGEEAIRIFGEQMIDAATVDFFMPGINGLELLHRLRNMNPACKFILLTGNTEEGTAQEAIRLGALYCPKPITVAQIDRILHHIFATGTQA